MKGHKLPSDSTSEFVSPSFHRSDVTVADVQTVYSGYATVKKYTLTHSQFSGGTSQSIDREIFVSGDAVVVLPFDVRTQRIVLIEQFRIAPLHGNKDPWLMECIAGRIDPGATPLEVAGKEALEEAGCELIASEEIGGFFPSPGIFAEHMTFFCALADLSKVGGLHGLDEEAEDIRAVTVGLDEALEALDQGHLVSGPTVLALLWLARNRERLTQLWSGVL